MTSRSRRIFSGTWKLALLALAILLTYQAGFALGRKTGKSNRPFDLESFVAAAWPSSSSRDGRIPSPNSPAWSNVSDTDPFGDGGTNADPFGSSDPWGD